MILAYHRINPWYKEDALTVSPGNFRRHIAYLAKYFNMPPPEKCFPGGGTSGKSAAVTFDDGFADNLWYAMAVLEDFGVRPLIFITAGYIGTAATLPRYKDLKRDRFLNWSEVKKMADCGVNFGSHALTHSHLPALEPGLIEKEVGDSKKMIEDKTGREAEFFCYPYGDFSQKVIDAVQKAGYRGAVVTPGKRRVGATRYTIPRTGIYGHNNFFVFRIKTWKGYLAGKYC